MVSRVRPEAGTVALTRCAALPVALTGMGWVPGFRAAGSRTGCFPSRITKWPAVGSLMVKAGGGAGMGEAVAEPGSRMSRE